MKYKNYIIKLEKAGLVTKRKMTYVRILSGLSVGITGLKYIGIIGLTFGKWVFQNPEKSGFLLMYSPKIINIFKRVMQGSTATVAGMETQGILKQSELNSSIFSVLRNSLEKNSVLNGNTVSDIVVSTPIIEKTVETSGIISQISSGGLELLTPAKVISSTLTTGSVGVYSILSQLISNDIGSGCFIITGSLLLPGICACVLPSFHKHLETFNELVKNAIQETARYIAENPELTQDQKIGAQVHEIGNFYMAFLTSFTLSEKIILGTAALGVIYGGYKLTKATISGIKNKITEWYS